MRSGTRSSATTGAPRAASVGARVAATGRAEPGVEVGEDRGRCEPDRDRERQADEQQSGGQAAVLAQARRVTREASEKSSSASASSTISCTVSLVGVGSMMSRGGLATRNPRTTITMAELMFHRASRRAVRAHSTTHAAPTASTPMSQSGLLHQRASLGTPQPGAGRAGTTGSLRAHDPAPDHERAAVHQRRQAPGQPRRLDAAGRRLRALPAARRGEEVLFICATDEHGTPAELAAAEAGLDVAEYCRRTARGPEGGRRAASALSLDYFGAARRPQNHELTQHFAAPPGRQRLHRGAHHQAGLLDRRRPLPARSLCRSARARTAATSGRAATSARTAHGCSTRPT